MKRKKKMEDELAPIPEEDKAEWDALVEQAKELVTERDKSIWKLILITGRIQTKYGENRIRRFADEIGLDRRTIYTYRWMAKAGVDEEFINKWSSLLGYTMVRQILRHTGRVAAPSTNYFLDYAAQRKITVRGMEAFMLETVAPDNMRERIGEDIKLALQDKQESEGFSDYIRVKLEEIAEEHPELQDEILRTAVVDIDDFQDLKVAAGIATDEEEKMVRQAAYQATKIKRYYRHIHEIKGQLIDHLENGHENADELRLQLTKLRDTVDEILKVDQIVLDTDTPAEEVKWN